MLGIEDTEMNKTTLKGHAPMGSEILLKNPRCVINANMWLYSRCYWNTESREVGMAQNGWEI